MLKHITLDDREMTRNKLYNNLTPVQKQILEWYDEFRNDYLTIEKFAEHKGISCGLATVLFTEARLINANLDELAGL